MRGTEGLVTQLKYGSCVAEGLYLAFHIALSFMTVEETQLMNFWYSSHIHQNTTQTYPVGLEVFKLDLSLDLQK